MFIYIYNFSGIFFFSFVLSWSILQFHLSFLRLFLSYFHLPYSSTSLVYQVIIFSSPLRILFPSIYLVLSQMLHLYFEAYLLFSSLFLTIRFSFTILPFYFMPSPLFHTPSILQSFAFFFCLPTFPVSQCNPMLPLKHFGNIDIWLNTPCDQFVFLFQYLSKQNR